MADVQDDDQWLYGDDKEEGEGKDKEKPVENGQEESAIEGVAAAAAAAATATEGGGEGGGDEGDEDKDKENEKDKEKDGEGKGEKAKDKSKDGEKGDDDDDDDDDSSDEDDLTITIGVLKTQPDIIQAPTAARFQPKSTTNTGLKDEDFTSPGKINSVPITEYNLADLEDKPWRKPGADISDYFNYGFNEETWFRYCERQKRMRINESGAGLGGLGITVTKPFGNTPNTIPVTIVNDNSKYGGAGAQRPKAGPPPRNKLGQIDVIGGPGGNKTSTIQVMTADRREYSTKVLGGPPTMPSYNDMEFGGNPYGETYYPADAPFYGNTGVFENPPPPWPPGQAPPMPPGSWDRPGSVPPPPGTPASTVSGYFEGETMNPPPTSEPEEERHRSRRSHRSRSRSPSRHRHSGRHRSRSRSPSHRHKRKKSKRERDTD